MRKALKSVAIPALFVGLVGLAGVALFRYTDALARAELMTAISRQRAARNAELETEAARLETEILRLKTEVVRARAAAIAPPAAPRPDARYVPLGSPAGQALLRAGESPLQRLERYRRAEVLHQIDDTVRAARDYRPYFVK